MTFDYEALTKDVQRQLRFWMKARDASQSDVAKMLGTSRSNVNVLLKKKRIALSSIVAIADVLGLDVSVELKDRSR
jgi:predicted XRE-type DNA-binding protein